MPPASAIPVGAAAILLLQACSLVTVPVRTGGRIVETAVSSTGDVVTAPFDAAAGRKKEKQSDDD